MATEIERIIAKLTSELEWRGYHRFTSEERRTFDENADYKEKKQAWFKHKDHFANLEVLVTGIKMSDYYSDEKSYPNFEDRDHKFFEISFWYNLPQSIIDDYKKFQDHNKTLLAVGERLAPSAAMLNQFLKKQLFYSGSFGAIERYYPCIESENPHSWLLYKNDDIEVTLREVIGVRVGYSIDCINQFPENMADSLLFMVDYASEVIANNFQIVVNTEHLRERST